MKNLENKKSDLLYMINDWHDGVSTRLSGINLRNEIINNFRETQRQIVIDFADLRVISSSFADEVLGKLVLEFGFFGFNNIVKLKKY